MKIQITKKFERSLKKYKQKHYDINKLFKAVECIISQDKQRLISQYKDHALVGNWKGYRELHIEGDWLLIYQIKQDTLILLLVDTGSHDDLF